MANTPAGDIAELVRRARAGDNGAWNRLIARFDGMLATIARSYRLTASDIEDVGQITWMRLFESLDRLRQPESLPGWLATTARRECLRLLRAASHEAPSDQVETRVDDTLALPPPGDDLITREEQAVLWDAVHELPDHHQRLLEALLTSPSPSYTDIARSLHMPVGSIGPTRARGIDRLRRNPQVMALAV